MLRQIRRPKRPEPLPLRERTPEPDGKSRQAEWIWLNVKPRRAFARERKIPVYRLGPAVLAMLGHKGKE